MQEVIWAKNINDNKRVRQSKVTVESKETDDILNYLTEALLSDVEQEKLLKPPLMDQIYHVLNRFGDLMGDKHLPTILCVVCTCKDMPQRIDRV